MHECSSYFFDMLGMYQKVVLVRFVSKYMEQSSAVFLGVLMEVALW
jgi:hypothetical protein